MLIAIPAHEAAHAWASARLGDSTAKNAGRLTLDPRAHFDLFGALCMIFVGVGWAKPVGIDPRRFRRPKRDMALSAAAGPACNLLLAYLSMLIYKVLYYKAGSGSLWQLLFLLCYCMVALNINLAVFNLLPVPPLDGYHVANDLLLKKSLFATEKVQRAAMGVMLLLMFSGLLGRGLSYVVNAILSGLGWAVQQLFQLVGVL